MLVEVEAIEDDKVRHMPAVCHSMNCDFTLLPTVGQVTAFTFNSETQKISITGTDLPDNISKIQSMSFAASDCTPTSANEDGSLDGTSVECTLVRNPTCGSWTPDLTTFLGNIPHAEDVAA